MSDDQAGIVRYKSADRGLAIPPRDTELGRRIKVGLFVAAAVAGSAVFSVALYFSFLAKLPVK